MSEMPPESSQGKQESPELAPEPPAPAPAPRDPPEEEGDLELKDLSEKVKRVLDRPAEELIRGVVHWTISNPLHAGFFFMGLNDLIEFLDDDH